MNTFLDYLNRNKPEYSYRLKFLDDVKSVQSELETFLKKYKLVDFGKIKKTIIHKRSLDFPGQENVEIYFFDIVTELPVSTANLALELCHKFGFDGTRVVVHNPLEPVEHYTDQQNQQAEVDEAVAAGKAEREPLMSTSPEYPEEEKASTTLYGDKYNESYLDTINKIREKQKEKEIKVVENPLSIKTKKEFKAGGDFNDKIKDKPKVQKLKAKLNMEPFEVKKGASSKAKLNSDYKASEK